MATPFHSGQTDIDLQLAVIDEVKEALKDKDIKKPGEEKWEDVTIYRQEKPWKSDENPEDSQEDYIIVSHGDEEMDDDWQWIVPITILVSAHFEDEEKQGDIFISDVLNVVYDHLKRKGIIAGKYELERRAEKCFNPECYENYAEGALITYWKLIETPTYVGELI